MSFKIPSLEEMEKVHENVGTTPVPSSFQVGRVSNVTCSIEQQPTSDQTSVRPQNIVLNVGEVPTTEGSDERSLTTNIMCVDEMSTTVPQSGKNLNAVSACSATSSSIVSSITVASASTEHTATTTNSSGLAQTSKGVVIRPVTTASESNGKDTCARLAKANSIIVSLRQRGNPILKFVRNVPWEFGEIVPDYQLSSTSCALYLSLRYHNLKPNYIHERLRQLANSYVLRVLLVQVDVKDCDHALKELAKICILADCTMVAAFTLEEAGRYLETYKSYESKPPDLIMEKSEGTYMSRVCDTLTSVKKVNKTDAVTLLSTFGSMEKIVEASEQELAVCPGIGPQKASRIHSVFMQPFLKDAKRVQQQPMQETQLKS